MSNIFGKATAMNVLTPIGKGRLRTHRFLVGITRLFPSLLGGLIGLRIIHFANWSVIRPQDWPDFGQGKEKLKSSQLLFISNYNGSWDQYIDAFTDSIAAGLDIYWHSAKGFPSAFRRTYFKEYIHKNEIRTDHYYSATPTANQIEIKASLGLLADFHELMEASETENPKAFQEAYHQFLIKHEDALIERTRIEPEIMETSIPVTVIELEAEVA